METTVKFLARQVGGKWAVIQRVGSRKHGYVDQIAPGFEGCAYTMHQAQVAAQNAQRDFAKK